MRVFTLRDGVQEASLRWQDRVIKDIGFSPDGSLLAGIGMGGAQVYRVADWSTVDGLFAGGPYRRLSWADNQTLNLLSFSPAPLREQSLDGASRGLGDAVHGEAHQIDGAPLGQPAALGVVSLAGRGGEVPKPVAELPASAEPVHLEASIDEPLSQWLWLVKWFLAIPHFFVLAFLWLAFFVVTFIAWWAILFTARYPEGLFKFNVGVMRWTWRVTCYAGPGGLGTDRYPPFTLDDVPDYPARFDVAYPERLSRGLIFVKSWLLAIPHYLVIALFVGGTYAWAGDRYWAGPAAAGGLIGVLVFIAAVILLFTRRYPQSLFALIIGLNRWVLRVEAYALLMTDQYPPFRLDQGGSEPDPVADSATV